jgi:hypothetical protein
MVPGAMFPPPREVSSSSLHAFESHNAPGCQLVCVHAQNGRLSLTGIQWLLYTLRPSASSAEQAQHYRHLVSERSAHSTLALKQVGLYRKVLVALQASVRCLRRRA